MGKHLLPPWDDVARTHDWAGLLLGNGASRAVWDDFGYDSLYDVACDAVADPLTDEDQALFNSFDTSNFEAVLSALATARLVNKHLGLPTAKIKEHYQGIRQALVQAVHKVHVPWTKLGSKRLPAIADELARFEFVFSSNYDLLTYWSIMAEDCDRFRDYFFSGDTFDVRDTEVWGNRTRVCYLHGGLHLCRRLSGGTIKRSASQRDLLSGFGSGHDIPLFISEGKSQDKLAAIRRSDYLSFVFEQFAGFRGPLVVFGHALSEEFDDHLVQAIRGDVVAIGMLPGRRLDIERRQAELRARLSRSKVLFFDAATHALGDPALRVNP